MATETTTLKTAPVELNIDENFLLKTGSVVAMAMLNGDVSRVIHVIKLFEEQHAKMGTTALEALAEKMKTHEKAVGEGL